MKKHIRYLLMVALAIYFYDVAHAQSDNYALFVYVRDQGNQPVLDSIKLSFRNTDSSTTTTNPYTSTGSSYSQGVWTYHDSGDVASNYNDSLITLLYKACGQWYTLDTFFNYYGSSGSSFRYAVIQITAPCYNPCNANFTATVMPTNLTTYFSPKVSSPFYRYKWYFGDGNQGTSSGQSHGYANPGTYTASLVVLDTLNNCTDSTSQNVVVNPVCNPAFYASHKQYGYVDVNAGNNTHIGFQHTWIIGDSIFNGFAQGFTYRFGAGGVKPIKHIVEYPGYCKDSVVVNPYLPSCQTQITSHQVNYRTLTVQPINNIDTFKYTFGDGTTLIARGPISYTYSYNNNFNVSIRDVNNYCTQKVINITTTYNCGNYFSNQVDSAFKMRFFITQASNGPIRRRINNSIDLNNYDTLYGDTVHYVFPVRGLYIVANEVLDSSGNAQCTWLDHIFVSSCGLFGWENMNDFITGSVLFNSSSTTNYDSLIVYLIEHDSAAGTLTAVDSSVLYSNPNDSAYFEFFKLCDSSKKYLVKAALLPGSGFYSSYLPTYYNQSASWSGGTKITAYNHITLTMLAGTNTGGPGFIGGLISQGANKKFKPLEGVQVTLFNEDDEAIDFRISDANGQYAFNSVAYGKYRVQVEILGKPSDSYQITLDAENETSDNRNFEVNSTYVSAISTNLTLPTAAGKVYPNPANESLFIEWTADADESLTISYYSLDGKLLHQINMDRKGETYSKFDVSALPRGLILMRIEGENSQSIQRITLY